MKYYLKISKNLIFIITLLFCWSSFGVLSISKAVKKEAVTTDKANEKKPEGEGNPKIQAFIDKNEVLVQQKKKKLEEKKE